MGGSSLQEDAEPTVLLEKGPTWAAPPKGRLGTRRKLTLNLGKNGACTGLGPGGGKGGIQEGIRRKHGQAWRLIRQEA